ncbi:MAG: alpha-galactosidase [Flavobacteriaceae bacterium]
MKSTKIYNFLFFVLMVVGNALAQQTQEPKDWLIDNTEYIANIVDKGTTIELQNGLVLRKIQIEPNAATTEFMNVRTGETFLRSIKSEAEVMINGTTYFVGGLEGVKEHGYFLETWLDSLQTNKDAFQYKGHEIIGIQPKINWNDAKRYNTAQKKAPTGKELIISFVHRSKEMSGVTVKVHYEIYDGLPLISKWISLENSSTEKIVLNSFKSELLAFPEVENPVETPNEWKRPNLHVESDYAFGGFTNAESNVTTFWETDPDYTSQVNYKLETPCLLVSKLAVGPNQQLEPKEVFESFHTYELLLDGSERERNALAKRKMYRSLAPWVSENPIFMHLTTTEPKAVKEAIDQCAQTGYEMVILSFGSGLNMEDTTATNIKKFKKLADYAHKKGIELGGYSLFSSRKIHDSVDVINKETLKPGGAKFGNAPCLASEWGNSYLTKLKYFLAQTDFDLLEHDGPYPGDYCASVSHTYHTGYEDSQWTQWTMTKDFYQWLRAHDIYLNAPDFYFLQGSNKCGIGYREVNWSLPRDQQILLGRQNIYDGTWEKTPSMAWTFVPLTEYHGGGAAATLEPLKDHLDSYEAHMVQNYGSGVQACYRGPRLYDSEKTKELVVDQIAHYKTYRDILNSDIIHLRRPNGRTWDGFMHVNSSLNEKAFVMLFNPTVHEVQEKLIIPLYYTGLEQSANVVDKNSNKKSIKLNRSFEIELEVNIPAKGYSWYLIR